VSQSVSKQVRVIRKKKGEPSHFNPLQGKEKKYLERKLISLTKKKGKGGSLSHLHFIKTKGGGAACEKEITRVFRFLALLGKREKKRKKASSFHTLRKRGGRPWEGKKGVKGQEYRNRQRITGPQRGRGRRGKGPNTSISLRKKDIQKGRKWRGKGKSGGAARWVVSRRGREVCVLIPQGERGERKKEGGAPHLFDRDRKKRERGGEGIPMSLFLFYLAGGREWPPKGKERKPNRPSLVVFLCGV